MRVKTPFYLVFTFLLEWYAKISASHLSLDYVIGTITSATVTVAAA